MFACTRQTGSSRISLCELVCYVDVSEHLIIVRPTGALYGNFTHMDPFLIYLVPLFPAIASCDGLVSNALFT